MPQITQTHQLQFTDTEVRKRFVAWDRGEAEREWTCLQVLAEHAPGLAPRPLRRETEDGAPVIVMERLPGAHLGGAALTEPQTVSLAAALGRMYAIESSALAAAGVGKRAYGAQEMLSTVREWFEGDYDLTPCQRPELVREAMAVARTWLAHPDLPKFEARVLGIADLNPANVMWDGECARLVDFEDGGLSDPAYEIADHVEHLGGRGVYDAEALIAAMNLTEREQERIAKFRLLFVVFWLAMLLPGGSGFLRNPPGTIEAQASRVIAALGKP